MKTFKKKGFFNSILTLASGSIIAQCVTIIASPITTRIYSPNELGVFTFISTVINIFGVVINGRIEMAIVTDNDESNIYPLISLSLLIDIILSSLVSIGYLIYFIFFKPEYIYTIIFIFILLFVTGMINILNSYNNRKKEYKLMTEVYVTRTITQNLFTIVLGLFKSNTLNLLISQVLGLINGLRKQASIINLKQVKFKQKESFIKLLKKHKKYILFSIPASFMNGFSYSSINIFVQSLFGMETLGYYSMSYRVLGIPLNIISNNVSRVFIQDATIELKEKGHYKNSFKKNFLFLIILSLLLFFCLEYIVPDLCTIFFGNDWAAVGMYIKILAPMFAIRLTVSALASGLIVSNKQNLEMLLQMFLLFSSLLSFLIIKLYKLNIKCYLGLINLSFSFVYLIFLLIIYKDSKGSLYKA